MRRWARCTTEGDETSAPSSPPRQRRRQPRRGRRRKWAETLRRLRTDRVELLQMHNLCARGRSAAPYLRELKASGKTKYIGVTHYHAGGLLELEKDTCAAKRSPIYARASPAVLVSVRSARSAAFSALRAHRL